MKKITTCLLLAPLIFCVPGSYAKVYQTPAKSYQTMTSPLAVTGSADGKYTFVLSEGGQINIYKENGEQDKLTVSAEFDAIYASATGDKIWLTSSKSKKVQEVLVDFVQNINIDGSPFLGTEQAAVTIVVFSDFQ
nr:hypothetical protein [Desulfobulbaceae bacterium]